MVVRFRQFLALQRLRITVDVFLVLRVFDELLEARVFVEVFAAAIGLESGAEHARERSRDGYGEDLQDRVLIAGGGHEADD